MLHEKMIKKIKRTLGYPIVPVELPDSEILEIIQDCASELYEYSSEYKFVTLPVAKSIDLSQFTDLVLVKDVKYATSDTTDSQGLEGLVVGIQGGVYTQDYHNLIQNRMILKAQQRLVTSVTDPLSWRVNGTELYIDYPDGVSAITIMYIKSWDDGILSPYWDKMLTRYSTARVNEVVGRARSKYKSSEGLYEVDASMLDTALEDITQIFEELRASDIMLPSEL